MRDALRNLPGKVGIDIQQTSEGFTMSKSEGGRTLFTIHASKATQFKAGGHATLHDVYIIVYGRQSDRFDRISGDDFDYDQQSGDGGFQGPGPHRSAGQASADKAGTPPPEAKNPIHLAAEGMTFNQKTGHGRERWPGGFPAAAGGRDGARGHLRFQEQPAHPALGGRYQHRGASSRLTFWPTPAPSPKSRGW